MKNESMENGPMENLPEIEQEQHERLCAYVFGELQGDERARFERELMQSPALEVERARLEATIGLVKRAIPDEGLSHAVRREVVASARRSRFRFLGGRRMLSLAAAGALLLGGTLAVQYIRRGQAEERGSYSVLDQKVASRSAPESVRVMKAPAAERAADAKEAPLSAPAAPADAAVSATPLSPEVQAQLEAFGYGGGASEPPATIERYSVPVQAPPSEPDANAMLVTGDDASKTESLAFLASTGGTPVGAGNVGEGTPPAYASRRAGLAGPRGGQATKGPASSGPSGPTSPGLASGSYSFSLEPGGQHRGAGDTVPPGNAWLGGREAQEESVAHAHAIEDRLRALGYSGRDDDEGEVLRYRVESARQPLAQSREQVAAQVEQLLKATRPAPGESPRDMFFRYWGDAPFVLAREEHLSTFAVDVDTASYALARSYLNNGQLPPRASIRTEEFVNYFRADQAPPTDGKPFAIGLELAPSLFATDTRTEMLRVTVRAKDVADFERQPVALTFVIDNSGSMEQGGRLELVKRSLALLLRQLYASDTVAVVKFSNTSAVVTPPLPLARRGALEGLIQAIGIEGGTNVEAGLRLGYELAVQNLQRNTVNRVVLCSDGVGNIGETRAAELLALVKDARAKGLYLNTVGVGMGNHNDAFLEQLANQGDGVCNYVDSDAEAKRVFVDGLASALQPVARDVKIQVELDPAQVESWRLLGYENRALQNRQFRDDAIDAGEVNAGHQVSALYELVRQPGRSGPLATVRVRYKPPFAIDQGAEGTAARANAEVALEVERTIASVEARPSFAGASSGYQRAVLVAQLAEVLRDSVHARGDSLATLVQESRRLAGTRDDPDLAEFVALLAKANPLLDARSKSATPKVQGLLDELALAQFELARGGRLRQLETDAAASPEDLERRLGLLKSELAEDGTVDAERREFELRALIQRLEAEVGTELGLVHAVSPAELEALKRLGYAEDEKQK